MEMNQIETTTRLGDRKMSYAIHASAWIILLGSPFFFTGREQQVLSLLGYVRSILVPLSFMVVFYVLRQLLPAHRPLPFQQAHVAILRRQRRPHRDGHHRRPPADEHPAHARDNAPAAAPRAGAARNHRLLLRQRRHLHAGDGPLGPFRVTGRWYAMESSRHELEKSRAEAELQNLKSQLNPHFLFNTLNNIYSLIAFSPERAQEAVHDLSRLLRYVLYDSSQPTVPLDRELNFINNYVELMRIRLPEQVSLTTRIEAQNPETPIAPLLFISLIENAFKHGVSPVQPSFIDIDIHEEEARIVCSIRNSCFPKDNERDKSGSGIGLHNLSRRLELLYPARHIFTYGEKEGIYTCRLELQT